MRFKSTGLGEGIELVGHMAGLSPVGRLLVCYIQTTTPVKWELKAALEYRDLSKIMGSFLKLSIILLVLRTAFHVKKKPKEPDDYMDRYYRKTQ